MSQLAQLVELARDTHELYATTWGACLVAADPDEVLSPYGGYRYYLEQARRLAPAWPDASWPKLFAVKSMAEVCMQPPIIDYVVDCGLDKFAVDQIPDSYRPDHRLDLLWNELDVAGLDALEQEALGKFGGDQRFDDLLVCDVLDPEPDFGDLWQELQLWLYEWFADLLRRCGVVVLQEGGHSHPSIELLRLIGERVAVSHVEVGGNSSDAGTYFRSFENERVMLRAKPLQGRVQSLTLQWPAGFPRVPCDPHLFIAVRPARRILAQYQFDPAEARQLAAHCDGEVCVTVRGSDEANGEGIVVFCPLRTPEQIHTLIAGLPDTPIRVSISASVLRREAWRAHWMDALTESATVTALCDIPLHVLFDEWRSADVGVSFAKFEPTWLKQCPFSVFQCQANQEGSIPFLAVCSTLVTSAAGAYARDLWPEGERDLKEEGIPTGVQHVLVRLAEEEPWFDFRGFLALQG